ncbi:hypothetical protein RND71_042485 [Anisodus tanguticus]|uniref:Uncharacterized protein n=1 Tax=Anisodus tanguticus TaxID=243964 RepID=A0AAE1QSI7_9SOLA|nr:hypothetical protein RND71_042485 [Anisodus tanguticus]
MPLATACHAALKHVSAQRTTFETKTSKEKSVISPDSHVGNREDVLVTTHITGNSELKQFTSNFLSLYCSELPSTLSLPSAQNEGASKRSVSPSILDVDNKNAKRICCISSENNSNINRKSNSEKRSITEGNTSGEARISLRKCNNAPVIVSTESETPGLTSTKLRVGDIPTQESDALKTHNELINSSGLGNGVCGSKPHKIFNECIATISDAGVVSTVGSLRKLGKDLDGEKSPMPVKHFDFAFDKKISMMYNLTEVTWTSRLLVAKELYPKIM